MFQSSFQVQLRTAFGLVCVFASVSNAGPRVIRDNRINDLGLTPALGRGYSMATNTFQSMCFGTIKQTKPSYDFKYRYVEIEKDWESNWNTSIDSQASFSYLFVKANASVHSESSGSTKMHYHYILAILDVDSYYNSINEGESRMSDSARTLLEKGDSVGFFDSCGPYYVRSLGRHSKFLAMLSYRTKEETRDAAFELKLKGKMNAFLASGSASTEVDRSFHSESSEKRLAINVWAYGLGKDYLADLIPTDIDSFKQVIKNSIKAMQDPDAGRVTTMEIVPWVENTEFQVALKLETVGDQLSFEKKKNIEDNSELIAELDRVDRAQMDQYFTAVNCKRSLDENYNLMTGDYAYNPDHTWFMDLQAPKTDSKYVTLKFLNTVLSKGNVDALLKKNTDFLSGAGAPNMGAVACMKAIFQGGIDKVNFKTIPACTAAREVSVPVSPVMDHYCMPALGKITKPSN